MNEDSSEPDRVPPADPAATVDQRTGLLERATRAHQAGHLDEAETGYRALLEQDPGDPDALHLLGLVQQARGRDDAAIALMERALARLPDSAALLTNLGAAYHRAGRREDAWRCYERAIGAQPDYALAYFNAGTLLHEWQGAAAALGHYRSATTLAPGHPHAHFNLGNALFELGRPQAAVAAYHAALQADPAYAEAWFNLGNTLRDLGQACEAERCYRAVIELRPGHAEAHNHLGQLLAQRHELGQAIRCYERALALRPTFAGTRNNLGNAFKHLKRHDAAIAEYRKAIDLKPDFAEAYHNLASVLSEQGRIPEAIAHYEQALRYKPDYVSAEINTITLRRQICDWSGHELRMRRLASLLGDCLRRGEPSPVDPFMALSLPLDPGMQLAVARRHAEEKTRAMAGLRTRLRFRPPARPPRRLRIGYVSPNFRNHPTAHLMVRLFGLHDRTRFEIFTYTWGEDDGSDYRRRIAAGSDHFVDLGDAPFLECAQRIADDGIHILVDRAGFTRDSRPEIFALRPAPIQVNYIGFPGSLGAGFIDYIITDHIVSPPEQLAALAEQPVFLPDCYLVTDPHPAVAEQAPKRAACGLPEAGFVFCCFNTNYKIEPLVFGVWMRILQRCPGSVLWLLRNSRPAEENLRREAAARGIDPRRLVFADKTDKAAHLARHRLADLFLDTLQYNAHTSAVDALWSGVPVLSCPGASFASRVAASALSAAGLPELAVDSLEAYEALAVTLATEPGRHAALRRRLVDNLPHCPLFDAERYARHLERAYERMWARHAGGEPPGPIDLAGQADVIGNAPGQPSRASHCSSSAARTDQR